MPLLLLLLFIGVPVAEIALFIELGGQIGLGGTLLAIVATALIGTFLVRQQGLQTLARTQAAMAENRMPVGEVIAGLCILIAGALLLTPGFLTDSLGFVLLIPPLRNALGAFMVKRMKARGQFQMHSTGFHSSGPRRHAHDPSGVIDGEYEDVTEDPGDPNGPARDDTKRKPDQIDDRTQQS